MGCAQNGSSFDCDSLLDCAIIIDLISNQEAILEVLNQQGLISNPPVKFGLLYNGLSVVSSLNITSSADWSVATYLQRNSMVAYVGGLSVAGGLLKINSSYAWDAPNSGAVNTFLFNGVGAGHINGASGIFDQFKVQSFIRFKVTVSSANATLSFLYNDAAASTGAKR